MTLPAAPATETWRILVVRHSSDEILVRRDGSGLTLPQVVIPARERIAPNINRAVEREFGLPVVSLYEIVLEDAASSDGVFYHAVAAIESGQDLPEDTYWASAPSLTAKLFVREADFLAIGAFRSRLQTGTRNRAAAPFLKSDWFAEVTRWVQEALRPHALRLTGAFRQLNANATFSLIRFETDQTPAWFKAVGEPNLREYSVTLALARLCPAYIPRMLAHEPSWNAWLTAQAAGDSLRSKVEMPFWESTASDLANLQIATIGETQNLLSARAHDLRGVTLLASVDPFFQFIAECTERLPPGSPTNLALDEVSDLKAAVRLALEELIGLGVIETVGHMDLNPGNIFCGADRSVFLDWAEAFVGCPLFSYEYLLQHCRRTRSSEPLLEDLLRNAYLRPWRKILSPYELDRARVLSPLVALFAYATTVWSSTAADISSCPSRLTYLLSLVRKMKRATTRSEAERVPL
jgi:hypothetical protein